MKLIILKKELIIIFEDYTITDVPTVVKNELITKINTEGTEFNSFLVATLRILTEVIEELEEGYSIIASSNIEYIVAIEFTAKTIVLLIEHEGASFKIDVNELESILINCKSMINAVDRIQELQATKLKELTPEEMLVVLTM